MSKLPEAEVEAIAEQIKLLATAYGVTSHTILRAVGNLIPKDGPGRPVIAPDVETGSGWRARIILFNPKGEAEADTMPERDPDTTPDVLVNTLPNVGNWLRSVAAEFHGSEVEGLDAATLDKSILSLRVSISRNGGIAWWRVPYVVAGEQWRANIRVERATD